MKISANNLIKKTNLNIKNMIRYGSIASISMIIIIYFSGTNNIMLAFPVALNAIALSFENIRLNTVSKTLKLILINSLLVILSYYATSYIYAGIIINFLVIFAIGYFLSFSYNPKIYKPFLMLYIFTSFSHDDLSGLLKKLLIIFICTLMVIIMSYILDKNFYNADVLKEFSTTFKLLLKQIDNCINNEFDKSLYTDISSSLRKVTYKIYINRTKKYLTTNIGKYQIETFLHILMINNFLYINFNDFKINDGLKTFKDTLKTFKSYITIDSLSQTETLDETLKNFLYNSQNSNDSYSKEFKMYIKNLIKTISKSKQVKEQKILYKYWRISKYNKYKYHLKNKLKFNSTRTRFSLRLSITLTLCLFSTHLFEFSKIIWIAITIMSVMQIYYEETLLKGKGRIKGNLIGISIFCIVSLIHIEWIALIVLFISLYLTYGFKEYYKLSIFTSLASLSATSLYTHINEMIITRIILVLIGILTVVIVNRFLFQTKVSSGIKILLSQLLNFNKIILDTVKDLNHNSEFLAEVLLLSFLTNEKIARRNEILKSKEIDKLLASNSINLTHIMYLKLIS